MSEKTIWLISTGIYSDYRVLAATETYEAARNIADRFNQHKEFTDELMVEECPIIEGGLRIPVLLEVGQEIRKNGDATNPRETKHSVWPLGDSQPPACSWSWMRAYEHKGFLKVIGTDHERVRKTFGDKSAQLRTDELLREQRHLGDRRSMW